VGAEQTRQFLIQLVEVILEHAQFLEGQAEQPSIDRVESRARAQSIAQLLGVARNR
jgi:hypothetical protein